MDGHQQGYRATFEQYGYGKEMREEQHQFKLQHLKTTFWEGKESDVDAEETKRNSKMTLTTLNNSKSIVKYAEVIQTVIVEWPSDIKRNH